MSTFRNPPLLGRMTVYGAIAAGCRFTGAWRPALRAVANKLMSPAFRSQLFTGYRPGEHDVFCTVFHKSGTNWLLQIVQQIAWHGAAEFGHIHDVAPWPESPFPGVVRLDDPTPWSRSPAGLRPIKTAVESDFVPYSEAARYIHVVRDPKEVAVSSYHFMPGVMGLERRPV